MITNILIAAGFFGFGAFAGSLWMTNHLCKAWIADSEKVIKLLNEYKKRWEEIDEKYRG